MATDKLETLLAARAGFIASHNKALAEQYDERARTGYPDADIAMLPWKAAAEAKKTITTRAKEVINPASTSSTLAEAPTPSPASIPIKQVERKDTRSTIASKDKTSKEGDN